MDFNHASIAFDEDLKELYGFARKRNGLPLDAGVVHETLERFTLNKYDSVKIAVFRIPVTEAQYISIKEQVLSLEGDETYLYNFFSVLTFPFLGGFKTYKAYTCSEFVSRILIPLGLNMRKDACKYTPNELQYVLNDYRCWDGSITDKLEKNPLSTGGFFDPVSTTRCVLTTLSILSVLLMRDVLSRMPIGRLKRRYN